jgi:hypothetical protein
MSSSTATTCTVPVSALRAAPYSLEWGTNVHATVAAINAYGSSTVSAAGNGAIITTTPGAPTNLVENVSSRSTTAIGVNWTAPSFIGGDSSLDYTVSLA